MDSEQRKISKITSSLPASNLKPNDLKFCAELVAYIGCMNGRNDLSVSIHDAFASRYKIIIAKMPTLSFDDIRQVEMMNPRIKSITIDLNRGFLIVESWKTGKEKETKKRRRETDDYLDLPSSFDMKEVEENDRAQIEGILKIFVNATELEFNVELVQNSSHYDLVLSKIELLEITKIDSVLTKFKAFVTDVEIEYPKKVLKVSVRKTDSPLEKIAPFRRKLKMKKT